MVKPYKLGSNIRYSFSKIDEKLEMPNLIEVQKESYEWFLTEGMREVLEDVSPLVDYTGNLFIEFVDFEIDKTPKYSVEECKERDVNYAAHLKVTVRLSNKETGEVKESEVFMGDFPLMTEQGTFVINGAERVVVSQIVRSPGIYYEANDDKSGKRLHAATVIPYRGAWLEYETDDNDIFHVRIDKNRKLPVTVFLRALGLGTDAELKAVFGEDEKLNATMAKDLMESEAVKKGTSAQDEALKEIYRKLRPGDPAIVESALTLINNLFFDAKRYDISAVGRYKFNKKLALARRIAGFKLSRPVASPFTGEILFDEGTLLSNADAQAIEDAGVTEVYLLTMDDKAQEFKVFTNKMADMTKLGVIPSGYDLSSLKVEEKVNVEVLADKRCIGGNRKSDLFLIVLSKICDNLSIHTVQCALELCILKYHSFKRRIACSLADTKE